MTALATVTSLLLAPTPCTEYVISHGDVMGLAAPGWPATPGALELEMTLGYGDAANTLGDGLTIRGPAVFDLALDPDLPAFLALATDGLPQHLTIALSDLAGHDFIYNDAFDENYLFGLPWTAVDLAGLPASGLQLNVIEFEPPASLIVFQWIVTGIPEPRTFLFIVIGFVVFLLGAPDPACWFEG